MPKSNQIEAKIKIHGIYMAPTRERGLKTYESFLLLYRKKYPKAYEWLAKDKDRLQLFSRALATHADNQSNSIHVCND